MIPQSQQGTDAPYQKISYNVELLINDHPTPQSIDLPFVKPNDKRCSESHNFWDNESISSRMLEEEIIGKYYLTEFLQYAIKSNKVGNYDPDTIINIFYDMPDTYSEKEVGFITALIDYAIKGVMADSKGSS